MAAIKAPPGKTTVRTYILHGVRIGVTTDDEGILRAVDAILDYFGIEAAEQTGTRHDLEASFLRDVTVAVPKESIRVLSHNGVEVSRLDGEIYLEESGSVVAVDVAAGTATGLMRAPLWRSQGIARIEAVNLVIHTLLVLLRRKQFYPLHAACLEKDGRGVLIAAQSNSGKSTLAYSLVRGGWSYLSDDSVLLRADGDAIDAYPLRRDFGLDAESVSVFPEIEGQWRPFLTDEKKRRVAMRTLYPDRASDVARPHIILFPSIVEEKKTTVEPLRATKALFRLMHQSVLLTIEPSIAAAHMEVLRKLVSQCRSYELYAGSDIMSDKAALPAILESIGRPN